MPGARRGWTLCLSPGCVRRQDSTPPAARGGEGFGEYLHLHSSPPCPILPSLPSMHLKDNKRQRS